MPTFRIVCIPSSEISANAPLIKIIFHPSLKKPSALSGFEVLFSAARITLLETRLIVDTVPLMTFCCKVPSLIMFFQSLTKIHRGADVVLALFILKNVDVEHNQAEILLLGMVICGVRLSSRESRIA